MKRLLLGLIMSLAALPALSGVVSRKVEYRDGNTVLEGYVAYNEANREPRPLVLVIHDWNGIDAYEEGRTRQLAVLGYVAFAIDVYGKGVRPRNPRESGAEAGRYYRDNALLRRRLAAGLAEGRSLPGVDRSRVAAIGYCFGGTAALEMARMGADVRGVVSFHGGLGTQNPARAGQVRARVLVLHGANDPLVPPDQVAAFRREMREARVRFELIAFPGAVHSFTVKGSERYGIPGVAYQAKADRESWAAMRRFFDRIFR